jgi:Tol biopolymer transport system component
LIFISGAGGDSSVWVMNADGSDRRQLTSGFFDLRPAVSPDGRYVVFTSTRSGATKLWRVDIEGGNLRQLTSQPNEDNCARYTPDGKWIVFQSWRSGKATIWKMPADGGDAVQLTDFATFEPEPSPDGKLIACPDAHSRSTTRVLLIPVEGGEPTLVLKLPANSSGPVKWTADGRALTFIRSLDGAENLWKLPLEGGQPTQLTYFKPESTYQVITSYALSPDGKRMAITRAASTTNVILINHFK